MKPETTNIKKVDNRKIRNTVYNTYAKEGMQAAFKLAESYGCKYESCKQCDCETPVIKHECLICGQATQPLPAPTSKEQLPEEEVLPKVTIEDNDGDWCVYDESGHLVYDGFETKEQAESYASEDGYEPVSEEEMKAFNKAKEQLSVVHTNWLAYFYDKNDDVIETKTYTDRIESEARSEAESYAENNSFIEDWTLIPVVEGEKLKLFVTGAGVRDELGVNDLLLRTNDHTIHLHKDAPHLLAHTLVDRYNEHPAMYRALKRLVADGQQPRHLTFQEWNDMPWIKNAKAILNSIDNK